MLPRSLTASLIRKNLPLRTLHRRAEEAVRSGPLPGKIEAQLDHLRASGDPTRVRIRDDRFYARASAEYVRAASLAPKRIYLEMVNRMGYSRWYCIDLVKEAIRRGLLIRTRGRAGGHLTDKAIELLTVQIEGSADVSTSASATMTVRRSKEG